MKIVMIEWLDTQYRGGWREKNYLQELNPAKCITIGIAHEKSNCYNVTQTISTQGDISEVISIPKTSITKITYLQVNR